MRVLAVLAATLALATALTAQRRPTTPASRTSATREAAVPFAPGETLTYDVSWSNFLTAATAVLRVKEKRSSFGATAWDISADGKPIPLIQRLYPVYYKMDTLLDSASLLSQWTGLYIDENGRKRQTSMRFDRAARKVHYELTSESGAKADLTVAAGTQDGLALLYAIRARALKPGERFTVPVADDGSLYRVDVEVSAPEQVRVPLGTMPAWPLRLNIVNDQNQPAGKNIVIWISTDARRLPVKMQAELPIGIFGFNLREAR